MLFQLTSLFTNGAILELSGEGSHVEMGGASISMSCPDPMKFNFAPFEYVIGADEVEVPLIGVPTSCAGIPLSQPCVELSTMAPRPPMFQCAVDGEATGGKIHASLKEIRTSMGELLEVVPVLKCPAMQVNAEHMKQAPESVSLSISFGDEGGLISPAAKSVPASVLIHPPSAPPPSPPCSPDVAEVLNYRVMCKNQGSWCTRNNKCNSNGGANRCCHHNTRCLSSLLDGQGIRGQATPSWSGTDWINENGWHSRAEAQSSFDLEFIPWANPNQAVAARLSSEAEANARESADAGGKTYMITGISFWQQQEGGNRDIKNFKVFYRDENVVLSEKTENDVWTEVPWTDLVDPSDKQPADLIRSTAAGGKEEQVREFKSMFPAKSMRFKIDDRWATSEYHGLMEMQIKGCVVE